MISSSRSSVGSSIGGSTPGAVSGPISAGAMMAQAPSAVAGIYQGEGPNRNYLDTEPYEKARDRPSKYLNEIPEIRDKPKARDYRQSLFSQAYQGRGSSN